MRLRLGASGDDKDKVAARLQKQVDTLNQIVPKYIYGYDDASLESVVGQMIAGRGGYLSVAESCTGGAQLQDV